MSRERKELLVRLYNDKSLTIKEAARQVALTERNFLRQIAKLRKSGKYKLIKRGGHNAFKKCPTIEYQLRQKNKQLQAQVKSLTRQTVEDRKLIDVLNVSKGVQLDKPAWLMPGKSNNKHCIATAMLSDTHFDEVVNPEEINGVNQYNRQIAQLRLQAFFRNVIRLDRDYTTGIKTDGLVLALGGDIVSGNIHEELAQSNEAHSMETALYWSGHIAAGIELLSKHFNNVYIPCVTGNHGRNTKKPRAKGRAQDNWDWLIYQMVARELRHLNNVTFDIPVGSEARWNVYGWCYQMTHGDQFRGGNGIAGILSPVMRGDHNKRKREQSVGTPYDYLLMGHFHQLQRWNGIIVNGSLKGYDEYAASGNFGFEPPQQAFFLTDKEHGLGLFAPVHVISREERSLTSKKHTKTVAWMGA